MQCNALPALFDAPARGKIEAAGHDVRHVLHNLSTNDILRVYLRSGVQSLCTSTAKVVAMACLCTPPEGKREKTPGWTSTRPGKVCSHLDRYVYDVDVSIDRPHTSAWQTGTCAACAPSTRRPPPDRRRTVGTPVAPGRHTAGQRRHLDPLVIPALDLLVVRANGPLVQRLLAAGALQGNSETLPDPPRRGRITPLPVDIDDNTFAPRPAGPGDQLQQGVRILGARSRS